MHDLCRLCALEKPHLIPTIGEENLDLIENISKLLSIHIEEKDNLPKFICTECFTKLNSFNDFSTSASRAQYILNILFDNNSKKCTEYTQVNINDNNTEYLVEIESIHEFNKNKIQREDIEISNIEDDVSSMYNNDEFPSDECVEKEIINQSNIIINKQHKKIRRDVFKKLDCVECNQKFNGPKILQAHLQNDHNKEHAVFKCKYCDTLFDKYRSFTRHVLNHKEVPRFICKLCNRGFAQKITLQSHLSSHNNDKNYKCDYCDRSYKQLASLYQHKKIHINGKNICDQCNNEFTSSLTLTQHKKAKHLNLRDEICQYCGKGYASKPALLYHIKSHTEDCEKQIKCAQCDKSFKTDTLLKRHTSCIHSDKTLYKCIKCPKHFKTKHFLDVHMKEHQIVLIYVCKICDKSFHDINLYQNHKSMCNNNTSPINEYIDEEYLNSSDQ